MGWVTNGIVTNAAANDILADTGSMLAGITNFILIIWTNVGGALDIVQRNATDTGDIHTQRIAADSLFHAEGIPINLALNQRLQIRVVDGYTGDFQASIMW